MTREHIYAPLQEIFRDVLDDTTIEIHDDMTANDVEDWDSLTHVTLITAIEKHFSIRFALAEIHGLRNIGDMVVLIASKVG